MSRSLPVPLPPENEQHQIVDKIGRLFSQMKALHALDANMRDKVESLRNAMLAATISDQQ
jgi:restriction endonuclease S subunit